jgi:hypothetical protein
MPPTIPTGTVHRCAQDGELYNPIGLSEPLGGGAPLVVLRHLLTGRYRHVPLADFLAGTHRRGRRLLPLFWQDLGGGDEPPAAAVAALNPPAPAEPEPQPEPETPPESPDPFLPPADQE